MAPGGSFHRCGDHRFPRLFPGVEEYPVRLVLIGIGISALTQACTTLLMIMGPIYRASQANIWITGTVNGSDWQDVWILLPWSIIFIFLSFMITRQLNIQELGEEVATSAGANVQRQRFILLLMSTALVGERSLSQVGSGSSD